MSMLMQQCALELITHLACSEGLSPLQAGSHKLLLSPAGSLSDGAAAAAQFTLSFSKVAQAYVPCRPNAQMHHGPRLIGGVHDRMGMWRVASPPSCRLTWTAAAWHQCRKVSTALGVPRSMLAGLSLDGYRDGSHLCQADATLSYCSALGVYCAALKAKRACLQRW